MTATGAFETQRARTGGAAAQDPGHLVQLDGLRAIAVMLVLFAHFIPGNFLFRAPLGEAGVMIFFVLSGYLITRILLRARRLVDDGQQSRAYTLRQFFARRTIRIFPLYYLVTLLMLGLDIANGRPAAAWLLTYTTNFAMSFYPDLVPGRYSHFWTLAIEEQFYLVWPLLIVFTPSRWLTTAVSAAVAASFTCVVLGLSGVGPLGPLPHLFVYVLGAGALLAITEERGWPMKVLLVMGVAGFLSFATSWAAEASHGRLPTWMGESHVHNAGATLAAVWLVAGAARGFNGPAARLLTCRPARYIGQISYGIYIIHMFVPPLMAKLPLPFFQNYGDMDPLRSATVRLTWMAVSILLAAIVFQVFERPVNGLKRHFPMRRPSPAPAPVITPA